MLISIGLSFFLVYFIHSQTNINYLIYYKKWQANADSIAKVSIEGW